MVLFNEKLIDNKGVTEDVTEDLIEDVTEDREDVIVKFMQENSELTTTEIAKKINVSRRTIARDINKLKSKGIITRVGSDKEGYWKVIKNVNN